jgi:hypothetical protein
MIFRSAVLMTLGEGARRMYDTYTLIHHFEGDAFGYYFVLLA